MFADLFRLRYVSRLDRFDKKDVLIVSIIASIIISAIIFITLGLQYLIRSVAIVVMVPMIVYVLTNRKEDPKRMMNEVPSTIGMMGVRILNGGSIDTAVRDVASDGPERTSKLFRKIVKNVDMRVIPDMKRALLSYTDDIDTTMSRSMHMLVAASETSNDDEKRRMVRDAENIAMNGLREVGERYGSSLNGPCMMIFGLGIMVPMILMSLLPMLNVGGTFSVSFLDQDTVAFITLIVIPAVVAVMVAAVASGNPFVSGDLMNGKGSASIVICIPIAIFLTYSITDDTILSILVGVVSVSVLSLLHSYPKIKEDRKRRKIGEALEGLLFDLGNRMLSGEEFSVALVSSLRSNKECGDLGRTVNNSLIISRGDVKMTVRMLSSYSKMVSDHYVQVYEASKKDPRDAGRLAINIGHQLQDERSVNTSIGNRSRSMTDMMSGTSMIFAPLIMGLSVVLLKPLSSMSGVDPTDVQMILMVYLIELALLVAVLTSYLSNKGDLLNMTYRFSYAAPIALLIFMAVSGISI